MQPFKNNIYIFFGIIFCLISGSCENAPGPETRLDFAAGSGLTDKSSLATGGSIISTSLYGQTTASNKFKKFKIAYSYDGADSVIYLDSTLTTEEFSFFFNFGTRVIIGKEKWAFYLEDEAGKLHTREYTLTTTGGVLPIHSFTSSYFRHNNFRNLQYFSTSDGTTHPGFALRNSQAVKERISFGMVPNTTSDTLVNLIAVNDTKFKTTSITSENFNNLNTPEVLIAAYTNSTAPEVSNLSNLTEGQVIAFKTKTNKSGLLRIQPYDTVKDINLNKYILLRLPYQVKVEK